MIPRIAVLDDEPRMAEVLAMVLRRDKLDVYSFTEPERFIAAHGELPFDLLLTDLKMPRMDGVAVLREARRQSAHLPVILVTAHGTLRTALAAMKEGAYDYLEKPIDNEHCRAVVARALELTRLGRENRYLRAQLRQRHGLDDVVAVSSGMTAVLDLARRAAASRSTVLITGESGTGKELVARAIHLHSARVGGPFIAVNCKALASGVIESELFGHERGAFTGAAQRRRGVFERADGGTLFLDEIGEVDLDFQTKLLRVLQEREVHPVGGETPRPIDVRFVAATQRDLQADVRQERFREDLYYRLAVIPIHVPPLRERRDDILPLARSFLSRMATELDRPLAGWTDEVEGWLVQQGWPGNVRELENTLERGAVLARDDELTLADVTPANPHARTSAKGSTLQEQLDAAAAAIRSALRAAGGLRIEAARRLRVERTTLYRLMKRYEIEID